MECGRCATPLDRPGDYCLVCHTPNADAVVVAVDADRAELTVLDGETVVGTTTVTTTPEADAERRHKQVRNFAGRIADEVRRKRPEEVYLAGERAVVRAVRADLHHDVYRVTGEDPVDAALDRREGPALDVVEASVEETLGGAHSTLIAGRTGRRVVREVAAHPHVKKIIPGPISAGGGGGGGVTAKVTRAGENGNVRLLLRDGSSVQENRVVTTAGDRSTGERVREDLADALAEAEF
jgi:hypothetical protein